MPNVAMENLTGMTIITVPGLDGSGPEHWQSRWDFSLPNCQRVQMGDWAFPVRSTWVERLDREIRKPSNPVLLAAHSLGVRCGHPEALIKSAPGCKSECARQPQSCVEHMGVLERGCFQPVGNSG